MPRACDYIVGASDIQRVVNVSFIVHIIRGGGYFSVVIAVTYNYYCLIECNACFIFNLNSKIKELTMKFRNRNRNKNRNSGYK